jgi:prevent-host-death family protein
METVNIHKAKTNLSRLVERAARGEQIIIANAGKPVAKLIAYHEDRGPRKPGFWKGQISIADDFDRLPTAVRKAFAGEDP